MRSTASYLVGLVTSIAVTLAGLWMTFLVPDPEYALIGWLLLVIGLCCIAANLALRKIMR
jgi:hypothetical protein